MQEYLDILEKSGLFKNVKRCDISAALSCLSGHIKSYRKNAAIFSEGDRAEFMGVVLEGEAEVRKTDFEGNTNIISRLFPSALVAASACYSSDKRVPFDIVCASETKILCINISRLIRPCCNACSFHGEMIKNLLGIIADKNVGLSGKIDILTKRTIRDKILSYLYSQSKKAAGKRFSVPLSRRQMADYLSTNRSALSRELSNMRDEGILEFDKNFFCLKEQLT